MLPPANHETAHPGNPMTMKTIQLWTMMLVGAVLAATPLRAEEPAKESAKEPAKEMKCGCCKKEDDSKKQEMEKKMLGVKAEAAELGKLVDEMNTSTGEKKIEAMTAIINKMVQKHQEMHTKMGGMMMMGMMKKDGQSEGKSG